MRTTAAWGRCWDCGRLALLLFCTNLVAAPGLWESRAPFPIPAAEVAVAAGLGKLYTVCGLAAPAEGSERPTALNSLFIYDPRLDRWTPAAPLPIAGGADHCNVAVVDGRLYVLGAIRYGTPFVDGNTYVYDPGFDRWDTIAQMNVPRGASGVAVLGTKIYVAGGLTHGDAIGSSVADFEVFDTAARTWTRLPAMPTARDHLIAEAVGGRFYAVGGRTTDDLDSNEEFNPTTSTWRPRAHLPRPRSAMGSGAIGNRIQVYGGSGQNDTLVAQNDEYDPVADSWRSLAGMPRPKSDFHGASLDGRIFAVAGGSRTEGAYTTTVDAFYLPPSGPPAIEAVRNAASFQSLIAAGGLISLFGSRFSVAEQVATQLPLANQMNGTCVKVNGRPAPLLYVGPGQVNFLLPLDVWGTPAITVSNAGSESVPGMIAVNDFRPDSAPGIFTLSPDAQGAIFIAGRGLIARDAPDGQSRPARKGEIVEVYCTGLGSVSSPPRPGEAASSEPLAQTLGATIVTIGFARGEVLFSGLAPGLVGVYQVNVRIPASAPTGTAVPLTININEQGLLSNRVTMAIVD